MDLISLSYYLAPIIGLTTIFIGLGALIKPQLMSENFGIKASGTANPYVRSVGVRDIFMGLTVLILFYKEQWITLGLIQFCIGGVAISDFLVVRAKGAHKISLVHFAGAVAVISYGVWLILVT